MIDRQGEGEKEHEGARILESLEETVRDAAAFLADADDTLFDGHQTAREVLSHLVFWHREYVTIVRAMVENRRPALKQGTFAELNKEATCEFEDCPMDELAADLLGLQELLAKEVCHLPDWEVNFPIKRGGRQKAAVGRLVAIEAHIRNHVSRLRRARRLGKEWVKAYYSGGNGGEKKV